MEEYMPVFQEEHHELWDAIMEELSLGHAVKNRQKTV